MIVTFNKPDLVPQEVEIWPVGQVHMLGLEQNPSPQVLRQIAAEVTSHTLVNEEVLGIAIVLSLNTIFNSTCFLFNAILISQQVDSRLRR